jgi:PTH1 family peptidyl-tRNA hydrolase
MHLVLGLGNPGARYERTRHNAGFLVVDRLASRAGVAVERKQLGALVESGRIDGQSVVFAKPQTFMNLSGQAAASLRGYFKVAEEAVVVVHDDVDLPFGDVRVKKGGGHGGHNGLRDLNAKLGPGYVRVRFGVGRPPEGWDTADYVLANFTSAEEAQLPTLVDEAADAVGLVVSQGVEAAMGKVNRRPRPAGTPDGSAAPR